MSSLPISRTRHLPSRAGPAPCPLAQGSSVCKVPPLRLLTHTASQIPPFLTPCRPAEPSPGQGPSSETQRTVNRRQPAGWQRAPSSSSGRGAGCGELWCHPRSRAARRQPGPRPFLTSASYWMEGSAWPGPGYLPHLAAPCGPTRAARPASPCCLQTPAPSWPPSHVPHDQRPSSRFSGESRQAPDRVACALDAAQEPAGG